MSTLLRAAECYVSTRDLWVVTVFFNPAGFQSRRQNYQVFSGKLREAGIPLLTVECVFGDRPFDLPDGPFMHRIRGRDVMWQKERLLNLAIAKLPEECRKVAWLDADVVFENPEWAVTAAARLDDYPVIQLFDRALRLPRGESSAAATEACDGFAAVYARQPQRLLAGDFAGHGHTGFAWAARREVLAGRGLYDACIAGSGDHMMAHALCGDWTSTCIDRIIGTANRHRDYFTRWCRDIYPQVRSRVGFVPGTVLHLWHGEIAHRRYVERNRDLAAFEFDPERDVRHAANGCWEWASRKTKLHEWAADYFPQRREDDTTE